MVEQWTHKPLVVGSNPTLATDYLRGGEDRLISRCTKNSIKIGSMIRDVASVHLFCADGFRRRVVYF
jgi:hypothetical protein